MPARHSVPANQPGSAKRRNHRATHLRVAGIDGWHVSRCLRHETRSPAGLLGAGGLHAQSISSTGQVPSTARGACALHAAQCERILWQRISGKWLGVAFRRQVPVGDKYIADFLAPACRLIVEVDDRSHELKRTADARRDRVLVRLGYRVLRLDAALVRRNVAEAVALIGAALCAAGWRPVPSAPADGFSR